MRTTQEIVPDWRKRLREDFLILASWAADPDRPPQAIRNKLMGTLAMVNHLLDLGIPDPK